MTTLSLFLLACLAVFGHVSVRAMLRHNASRGTGLPPDVARNPVRGVALGNSLWTGERSSALAETDERRIP